MTSHLSRAPTTASVPGCIGLVAGLLSCGQVIAECRLFQIAELPVDTTYNRVLVGGQIHGQKSRILIDTGSAISLIWRPAAKRLGLRLLDASNLRVIGVGGESIAQSTLVDELSLGQYSARKLNLPVAGDRDADFDMILGENFFAKITVEFDLAHRTVRLLQPKGCRPEQLAYWAQVYSMADLIARPADSANVEVRVLLNGKSVDAIIDSGSPVSLVSTVAAERAGVFRDSAIAGTDRTFHGVGRGSLQSWVGTFASFSLGDETIQNAKLRVADLNANAPTTNVGSRIAARSELLPTMIIGTDFLMSHRLVVAGPDRKMLFTYEGGPVFQILHTDPPSAAGPGAAARPEDAAARQ